MQATRPSNTAPASHGSRTLTVTNDPTQPEASSSSSTSDPAPSIEGTVRVRGTGLPSQRVQWTEETVDNEGLGRKKSKICCIYHKPKEFDESSDESSSDDEGSDSSIGSADSRQARRPRATRRTRHHDHHDHDADGHCSHAPEENGTASGTTRNRATGTVTVIEELPTPIPNAYERQPGAGGSSGKGKGKA